jgi:hypothetical protein
MIGSVTWKDQSKRRIETGLNRSKPRVWQFGCLAAKPDRRALAYRARVENPLLPRQPCSGYAMRHDSMDEHRRLLAITVRLVPIGRVERKRSLFGLEPSRA